MNAEVIVIGAGLSGLSAAKWLNDAEVSTIVLEARDRVGGRTWTKHDPKVNYVDIGGSYVGPTQNRVLRLAKELGVQHYKVNEVEDLLHYKDGRRLRFRPCNLPVQNPLVAMDLNNAIWLMEEMMKEIPMDAPWNTPKAEKWDTMTFEQFLNQNCWTKGAKDLLKDVIGVMVTSEAYEASLLGFLWYIKQCGGIKRIFSTTNGGQERKFVGGSQQLSEKLAEKLGNQCILNSPVVGISQDSNVVTVKTLNEKSYTANYVILACSPMMQMKIHFNPALPPLRNQMMQRVPTGSVMKLILYYRNTFWRNNGLCGSLLIQGGDDHPVFLTLDDTKPDGSYPALIGFLCGDKCRKLTIMSPEERKTLFARSLAEATGCKEALQPVHYEEKNWMEEQYAGGCYTAMYPPGFFTRYGKIIREPVGRLYFAGTETATWWSGYMEGAIQAGERAAREILHAKSKITRDRIWLEEPQSQDVIPRDFEVTLAEKYLPSVPTFYKLLTLSMAITATAVAYTRYGRIFNK